jgi:hypothetical protein
MRRAIDQIEQAPSDDDIKRGVLLDLPRVDDLHPARQPRDSHGTATFLIAFGKSTITLVRTIA